MLLQEMINLQKFSFQDHEFIERRGRSSTKSAISVAKEFEDIDGDDGDDCDDSDDTVLAKNDDTTTVISNEDMTMIFDRGGCGDSAANFNIAKLESDRVRKNQNEEAYKKWLQMKEDQKLKRQQQEQKRKEMEIKKAQEENELKQKLSQKKVNEWFIKKSSETNKKKTTPTPPAPPKKTCSKKGEKEQKQKVVRTEDCKKTYNLWLEKKKVEEKAKKQLEVQKKTIDEEFERHRRELAGVYYVRWTKTADKKGRPVPLNRGMESLRGSVSSPYVNPIPWNEEITIDY